MFAFANVLNLFKDSKAIVFSGDRINIDYILLSFYSILCYYIQKMEQIMPQNRIESE